MPRATCRCGQKLSIPVNGPDRVVCPKCSARIRVRVGGDAAAVDGGDGFLRFACPCGRRLKVRASGDAPAPQAGRCPDCGRIVPVPGAGGGAPGALKAFGPETPTEDMNVAELAELERWSRRFLPPGGGPDANPAAPAAAVADEPETDPSPVPAPAPARTEAGLRICTSCGRPLHLSATTCRECGAPAPKR